MSIKEEKTNPSGSVLWYWYNETHKSSKENTKESARVRIRRFERFLAVKGGFEHDTSWTKIEPKEVPDEEIVRPRDVNEDLVYEFIADYLTEAYDAETQRLTLTSLSSAYDWLATRTTAVDADPISYTLDDHSNLLDQAEERNPHIFGIKEAREIINSWGNPRWMATNLLFVKTLRRRGGVLNLDIADVNLDHPGCDWEVRQEVRHWDDHIVFRRDKAKSDRGRNTGNKTETTRLCAIDDELKNALIWYLTIRPGSLEPDEPLFKGVEGGRLPPGSLNTEFRRKAKEKGHYYDARDDDNVNPHYWRHWGTTWFEDRLGENNSITDYLRGDKGSIKTRYNKWSEEKKDIYLEHVPKFFTDD